MFGPDVDLVEKYQGYSTFKDALSAYIADVGAPVPWNPFQRDAVVIGEVYDDAPPRGKSADYSKLRAKIHENLYGEEWRKLLAGAPATGAAPSAKPQPKAPQLPTVPERTASTSQAVVVQ